MKLCEDRWQDNNKKTTSRGGKRNARSGAGRPACGWHACAIVCPVVSLQLTWGEGNPLQAQRARVLQKAVESVSMLEPESARGRNVQLVSSRFELHLLLFGVHYHCIVTSIRTFLH